LPRLIRSAAALAVLLLAVVGVPLLLVQLPGLLPRPRPGRSLLEVLLRPDDGSVLLTLITLVAWLAWAVFTASVLAELVALVSRQRVRVRLPGLGGPQRAAAGLLVAVLALTAAPAVPHAGPAPPAARADTPPSRDPTPVRDDARDHPGGDRAAAAVTGGGIVHLVRPGDDLWGLAERYYGDGRQWRRIATANPTVLTGGPDRLSVGWRLTVPDPVPPEPRPGAEGPAVGGPAAEVPGLAVTVRTGDSLSSLADRELGAAERWPELYRANRAQLSDPDDLDAGMRLVVPGARPASTAPGADAPTTRSEARSDRSPPPVHRPGPRQDGPPPGTPTRTAGAPAGAAAPAPVGEGPSQPPADPGSELVLSAAGSSTRPPPPGGPKRRWPSANDR
jgi:nucleoid-associated protein YgaU